LQQRLQQDRDRRVCAELRHHRQLRPSLQRRTYPALRTSGLRFVLVEYRGHNRLYYRYHSGKLLRNRHQCQRLQQRLQQDSDGRMGNQLRNHRQLYTSMQRRTDPALRACGLRFVLVEYRRYNPLYHRQHTWKLLRDRNQCERLQQCL